MRSLLKKIETLQDNMKVNIFHYYHILIELSVVRKSYARYIPTHNDLHQNLLDIDIHTKLIEFERIANSIQLMPSGGMVSWRRRLITVKLAMRAIIDGIEGDFLETVSTHVLNIQLYYYHKVHRTLSMNFQYLYFICLILL